MHKWRTTILLFLPAALAVAQTRVELSTQTNGDFSRANATKPAKAGTTLPANCSPGEVFFKLDATAGQNLQLCTSTNTWTQLTSGSGGGGGTPVTSTAALTDLAVTLNPNTPNQLSIASACTSVTPCNVRFGASTFKVTSPATLTVPSGAAVGGMAYIYIASSDGSINVWTTITGGAVTCSSPCNVLSNISQFPSDSIPVATWSASAGRWDAQGGTDLRAFLSNRSSITSGTGIVVADAQGRFVVSADTSVIGVRVAVPPTAASACVQGNYAADASFFYQCVATNTWLRVALATW